MENAEKNLIEYYKELPRDLQEVIISQETQTALSKVGSAHHLSEEQKDELSTIVEMTLLGFENSDTIERTIEHSLRIPAATSTQIKSDLNKEIFNIVKDSLELLLKEQESENVGRKKEEQTVIEEQQTFKKAEEGTVTAEPTVTNVQTTQVETKTQDNAEKEILSAIEHPETIESDEYIQKSAPSDDPTSETMTPTPTPPAPEPKKDSVFEKKLNEFYKTPRQQTVIDEGDNSRGIRTDPYREPI